MKRPKTETLRQFARMLARKMGLHFPEERLDDLAAKLAAAGREAGHQDLEKYLLWLMSAPLKREQIELLARVLTIGETYFLRDPKSYQVLEQVLLPGLIAARRAADKTLRIWSAGCSTGEEPYSIAILLSRAIPDLADWKIVLHASDINPQALERGRRGVYGPWSFRNAPPWLMEYFGKQQDETYQVAQRIRKLVQFSQLNLADDWRSTLAGDLGEFDVIFCRNVMLYFDAAQIEKTMAKFQAALRDGGWLFVGPTEVNHSSCQGLSYRQYDGAFVLAKETAGSAGSAGSAGTAGTAGTAGALGTAGTVGTQAERGGRGPGQGTVGTAEAAATQDEETPLPAAERYAQALELYRMGRYREAAEAALGCPDDRSREHACALALAARAFANIGMLDPARECCEQAIACDRLSAPNHYLLSVILEQLQDAAGAVLSLQRALYLDHDYLLAYFSLGSLLRQAGDRRGAQRNFANALRLLERRQPQEVLEDSEGMTAGALAQIIRNLEIGSEYGS